MYVDILFGREAPRTDWYLQAIGRTGMRNSAYRVLSCYRVKRRDPKARPRFQMEVQPVKRIPPGAHIFEFRWYSRKRKKTSFEQYMSRRLPTPCQSPAP